MSTKLLMIGCGDLAQRTATLLEPEQFHCFGLRRHVEQLPERITGLAHDLNASSGLTDVLARGFDKVLITLVPNDYSPDGYRQAYVDNLEKVLSTLQKLKQPPNRVLFVSSTSVYGHNNGAWVDEQAPAVPRRFNGERLLEAEGLVMGSGLPHSIVRFSGIYGPGRLRLINQVRNGEWKASELSAYSNRIHADDCAGILAHLLQADIEGQKIERLYIGSDSEPTLTHSVKTWLASQLGVPVLEEQQERNIIPSQKFTGKRCSNQLISASGYRFKYPTFRQGYRDVLGSL